MKVNEIVLDRELNKLNYGNINISPSPDNVATVLDNARILAHRIEIQDQQLVERILNLPVERQNEIIWQLDNRPGIDVEISSNAHLTPEQFREHVDIANYNYNIEYGHLKDTGRIAIDTKLIQDPNLTSQQLYIIHHTTADNLSPDKLFLSNGQPLSDQEMASEFIAQTENRAEVNVKLEEIGIAPFKLQPSERQYLNDLHYEGKSQPEKNNKFNQIINSQEIKDPQLRSDYLVKMKEPESKELAQIEQPGIINRLFAKLDFIKSQIFKTPEQEQSEFDALGQEYNTKFKKVMVEGADGYYQSSDKSINIHEDSIEVAKLSPEAVDLAIAATIAKFGNNIQVSGSDEFKGHVLNALAANDKFKDVTLDDPELQTKLTTLRDEQEQTSITNDANTLSAGNRVIENEPLINEVNTPENTSYASLFYERVFQDIEKTNYSPEEKDYLKLMAEEDKQRHVRMPDEFFNKDLDFLLDVHFPIEQMIYYYRTEQAFYEKILQDIEKSSYSSEEKDYLKFRASFEKQNSFFDEENFNISQIVDEYRTNPRLREEHQAFLNDLQQGTPGQQQPSSYQKFAPTEIEDLNKAEIGKQHLSVFENDDYLFVVAYDNKEELRECFDDLKETLPESVLQELNESKENDSLEEFIEKLAEAHDGEIHSVEDYIENQNQNERD